MVLVGVREGDTAADAEWLAQKTVNMRIFDDDKGVMNRNVLQAGGQVLAVSQFTLNASTRKGNRPSYIHAAGHELAIPLYEHYCACAGAAAGQQGDDGPLWGRHAGSARQRRPCDHHCRLGAQGVAGGGLAGHAKCTVKVEPCPGFDLMLMRAP
jgi:hypothetical protein